jgi:hypothetical protein
MVVDDAYWAEQDPRLWAHARHVDREDWRLQLIDQMCRRVAGGVRDWGPILLKSRQGQRDLVAFANVRVVLLELDRRLRLGVQLDTTAARELQHVVRRFAHLLEVDQQTSEPRKKLFVPDEQRSASVELPEGDPVASVLQQISSHIDRRTRPPKRRPPAPSVAVRPAAVAPHEPDSESLAPPR